MIRLLITLLLLLISGWIGVQLHKDPGYMMISIHNWTIETTVVIAFFASLLFFLLCYFVITVLIKIVNIPGSWHSWRYRRRHQKAKRSTRQGLIEYSEGYWKKARQHLIEALPNSDMPLVNYLTAARAAQKLKDNTLRDHYLRKAKKSMPEAKIAVELTQAELQLANNQWEQALATLKHLLDLEPHHPYVLKLLMNLYIEIKDWKQLLYILPKLKKYGIVSPEQNQELLFQIYYHSLKELTKTDDNQILKNFMNDLPKSFHYNPELNQIYCQYLINHNQQKEAEKILRYCLKKEFNNNLISLYGLCEGPITSQLNFAESLLNKTPYSAYLYLALGRLSIKNQLWGKAQDYLKRSIELQPIPENYMELGRLYEEINEPTQASACFKQGLAVKV